MHPDVEASTILDSDEESPIEDRDLIVGSSDRLVPLVCPITQVHLREPLRNSACKHTYSREAIYQMLQNRASCKCPVVGCNADVTKTTLRHDAEAQQKVDRILFMRQFKEALGGDSYASASPSSQRKCKTSAFVEIEIN